MLVRSNNTPKYVPPRRRQAGIGAGLGNDACLRLGSTGKSTPANLKTLLRILHISYHVRPPPKKTLIMEEKEMYEDGFCAPNFKVIALGATRLLL